MKKTSIPRYLVVLMFLLTASCSKQDVEPRAPSMQPNVVVLDLTFTIPGLERERTVRLYLPPGYRDSRKAYPVLYMHDGQNLFDDATSYAGEWGVDETLNRLAADDGFELIVVGIDNGGEKRMNELSPWANAEFGDAEGEAYMDFIVKVLKPHIDANYRTLPGRENTAIMGSSMGGLISHYAIYDYPQTFSKAGIFSPSYWFSDQVAEYTRQRQLPPDSRLYLLMGKKEGKQMVGEMQAMAELITTGGHPVEQIISRVADGDHNESFWRSEFEQAVLWLFE